MKKVVQLCLFADLTTTGCYDGSMEEVLTKCLAVLEDGLQLKPSCHLSLKITDHTSRNFTVASKVCVRSMTGMEEVDTASVGVAVADYRTQAASC